MKETIRRRYTIHVNEYGERFQVVRSKPHEVEIEVEIERLAEWLGAKAVRSKGGKSVEAGGLVKVRKI